jgi:hypothetical protein
MSIKLQEIDELLGREEKVDKELIVRCFESDDPDLLGFCYDLITDETRVKAVFPEFSWNEVHQLVRCYYWKCIENDYSSQWADSRFFATMDCINWLRETSGAIDADEKRKWISWINSIKDVDFLSFDRLKNDLPKNWVLDVREKP